jgi:hypothetical protein
VLSFESEQITAQPEVAASFCTEFGVAIWDIKSSIWSAEGAEGTSICKAKNMTWIGIGQHLSSAS